MNGQILLTVKIVSSILSALAVNRGDSYDREPMDPVPTFNTTSVNVTGIAGATANLPCHVENKGDFRVIWMNPRKTVISTDDSRLIDDSRMSVERPKVDDWNLMVRDVRSNDTGEYMCQINGQSVQIKRLYLTVLVAPEIFDAEKITTYRVDEWSELSLPCIATGVPTPTISWFKQGTLLEPEGNMEDGVGLLLPNASRYCDGRYQCNADNGVEPVATKIFKVIVEFPPEVMLRNKRLGQKLNRETILECTVAASPHASIVWLKDGKDIPPKTYKYSFIIHEGEQKYEKTLSLNIINLEKSDFGNYTCSASNQKGRDQERMLLYEYIPPSPPPSTTRYVKPPKTLRIDYGNGGHGGTTPYTPSVQLMRNGTERTSKLNKWSVWFLLFLFLVQTW